MNMWRATTHLFLCGCFAFGAQLAAQSQGDYDRAVADFRAGKYESAATGFAATEAATPGLTGALLYQAKSLVHLEKFAEAEGALRGYLKLHHDASDALYLLGFVLNRENRASDSLAVYTQAAAITRPASDDLKIVGLDYVLLDDYPDAIRWLEKAVSFDKTNKDAWYYLGRAYYTRSQMVKAKSAFETALKLDPRDAKAENGLGLVFESGAQSDAAVDAYRKAIAWDEDNPRKSEQPYVNLGSLLLEQGRTTDAIPPLETAVKLAPKDAYCRLRLGAAYFRNGEPQKAQTELEKAIELDPANASAHYELGRVYQQLREPERAKAEFEVTSRLQSATAGTQAKEKH